MEKLIVATIALLLLMTNSWTYEIMDPCATVRCPANTVCNVQQVECDSGPPAMVPVCVKQDKQTACYPDCAPGTFCKLQDVWCVTWPCYPVPVCVSASEYCGAATKIDCPFGTKYVQKDVKCRGKAPCCPVHSCEPCLTCATVLCIENTTCINVPGPSPNSCPKPECVPLEGAKL